MDIIGLFIEMGVMQVDIEKGETFITLGEKVMAETLEGLANVQPGMSSADTNRAYDVVLNFIQASFNEFAGMPVTKEPIETGHIDAAHNLRLQIIDYDASGNFVRDLEYGGLTSGQQELSWDGYDYLDGQLPDGNYFYDIAAVAVDGHEINVASFTSGLVTGVNYKNGQAYLITEHQEIAMGDVIEVVDP